MKLFRDKRSDQKNLLSLFIPFLPIFLILGIGSNEKMPTGFGAFILFVSAMGAYSFLFIIVREITDSIFSSRYEKRYLSERDISRLDDDGKAIVRDFIEKHGTPITEKQYDSIMGFMNLKKIQMKADADKAKALSSQKKALINKWHKV
jgi:hypothetical protein